MRLAILVIAPVCAAASIGQADTTDPMGAVRQYIDAFNKGDKTHGRDLRPCIVDT